jgi:hypothetical protein
MECLGSRIVNAEMKYDIPGVGIFDFSTEVGMFARYTGKVMARSRERLSQLSATNRNFRWSRVHRKSRGSWRLRAASAGTRQHTLKEFVAKISLELR